MDSRSTLKRDGAKCAAPQAMRRLLLIFLVLALLVVVPFLIWGDWFEASFSQERTVETLRGAGAWAWLVGIALLVADLFLPIPGTVVMSALGLVYGWALGGALAAAGWVASGLLAYSLCRKLGRGVARFLAGEKGLAEGDRLFHAESAAWLVALSRWMPVLPEVVACLAGLHRMPFPRYLGALCAGSVPMGFAFAWIGHAGAERPIFAVLLSAGVPPLIWGGFLLARRAGWFRA